MSANDPELPWSQCWVGIIDVLGFSASLKADKNRLARAYIDSLKELKKLSSDGYLTDTTAGGLKYSTTTRIFSDSIIVIPLGVGPQVADERENQSNLYFVTKTHVRSICRSLLMADLPTRGALAFGELLVGHEQQVFLGSAITRAHAWEQAQDWAWISVAPNSLHQRFSQGYSVGGNEVITKVPTKSGPITTISYAPALEGGDGQDVFEVLARVVTGKLNSAYSSESPDTIRKWANTASFFSAFMPGYIQPHILFKAKSWNSLYVR